MFAKPLSRLFLIRIAIVSIFISTVLIGFDIPVSRALLIADNQIVVTSLDDNPSGICPDSTRCTLRAAINQADHAGVTTMITFNISGTIMVTSLLGIGYHNPSAVLIIDGSGQSVVIDGSNKSGIFEITGQVTTTLNDLTIQNGSEEPAISNSNGMLIISNSTILNNSAGGIDSTAGTTLIRNTTLTSNTASDGGAIYNGLFGNITISHSTIFANTASDNGGGIYNLGGHLNMANSIVAHNTAAKGPDIFGKVVSLGHNLIGNGSDSSFLIDFNATATSIASMSQSGTQSPYSGTATAFAKTALTLTPAGYATPTPTATPIGFVPTATQTPLPLMQNSSSDQVGTAASPIDPKLGSLAAAGGSAQTFVLLPGSPAIGHGDCSGNANIDPPVPAVTIDQRGVPRGNPCSIGAYEGSAVSAGTVTPTGS